MKSAAEVHVGCNSRAIAGTGVSVQCQKLMASKASLPNSLRVPVIQEELQIGRRIVDTGRGVRVSKTVTEETLHIDEALQSQTLQVEHVPIDTWIEGAPPVQRQEGGTLIIPVLEEVLVMQKRVRLKEEIRITARPHERHVSEQVVLREEHVTVARFDEAGTARDVQDTPPP